MKLLKLIDVELALLDLKYGAQQVLEALARQKGISLDELDEQIDAFRAKKSKKKTALDASAPAKSSKPPFQSDLAIISDGILKRNLPR